jgi:hypothetical protein
MRTDVDVPRERVRTLPRNDNMKVSEGFTAVLCIGDDVKCMYASSSVLIGWILRMEHPPLHHTVASCSYMSIVLHSMWSTASVSHSHRSPSTGLIHQQHWGQVSFEQFLYVNMEIQK